MSHHFDGSEAANRRVVGSGRITSKYGRSLSSLIAVPASAMEVAICANDGDIAFTTDGLTTSSRGDKIGIFVENKQTVFITGDDLIRNINIDTGGKYCYIEFYTSPGSIHIS